MASRDDAIQRLNAEIGKLRQIRQEKLGEVIIIYCIFLPILLGFLASVFNNYLTHLWVF